MKILCSYLGGSHSYGLATPESDKDERGLFIHTEISKIIGLERHEHQSKQTDGEDSFYWELRHFLNLLKRGNTMCLEILFNDKWTIITPEFQIVQSKRNILIDSHLLYRCLRGYTHSERALVMGMRTGVLGGKRKAALDKYGYSYKNLVQFLRLCLAGEAFFQEGFFPVDIRERDEKDLLFSIKTRPGDYSKDDAVKFMDEAEKRLNKSYEQIKIVYRFDEKAANDLCFKLYMPILKNS